MIIKKGARRRRQKTLVSPSCISHFTNYKQKTLQKTTCTFSTIMKMSNEKISSSYNILDKRPWDSTVIFIIFSVISPISSFFKQCILFEIFLQFSLPPVHSDSKRAICMPSCIFRLLMSLHQCKYIINFF